MSAVVDKQARTGAQKYVNFDEFVDFQVNKTRTGIRHADLLQAVVTVLLIFTGYLLAFVVADQWLIEGGVAYGPRLIMLAGVGAFLCGWTIGKIVLPYWKRVTSLYAARELEQSQPDLKSSLLTLVDLKQAQRDVSPQILSAMEKRAALQLSEIDVDDAVDRRPLMRLAVALLAVVVALCLYTILSPKPIGASILRALVPIADVGVATRTRILGVDPGEARILARSQLEVTVDVGGEIPPEATLLYSTQDHSLVDEPVVLRDTGEGLNRFRGTLSGPNGRGLLQDFTYRITAGDAVSETYSVSVSQAPYATIESVTYTYPQYMELDSKTQSGGDIDAWEGTQVTLRAVTNMPVAAATLRLHDDEDASVKAEERLMRVVDETHLELTLPWTLEFRNDGGYPHYYSIDVRTADEQRDPVPRLYGLTIRRDLPPEIKLLHPSGDIQLPANAVLPVSFSARDPDFMLRSVRMHFEQRQQLLEGRTRHLYDAPPFRARVAGRGEVDLSQFDELKPGDVLTFWLEAWDNMAPLGNRPGNRSVTPKINITVVAPASQEEVEQRRAAEAAAAEQRLEEAEAQTNPEAADAEPQPEDRPSGEEQSGTAGQDPAATDSAEDVGESQPGDDSNSGEQQTSEQQPGSDGEGTGAQSDPATERSDGAQPSPDDGSSDGEPQAGGNQNGAGEQSPSDDSNPQTSTDNDGRPASQKSRNGEARQQNSAPDPGREAADDEALERFFQEYADEIKRQQQRQQQTSDSRSGDASESNQDRDAQSDSTSADGDERGSQQQRDEPSDGEGSAGAEDGDRSGGSPNEPDGRANSQNGRDGEPSGDPQAADGPQDAQPSADPRANQDPRNTDQDQSSRGQPTGAPEDAERRNQRGDEIPPVPSDGRPSPPVLPTESPMDSDSSSSDEPSSDNAGSGEPSSENTGEQNPESGDRSSSPRPGGDPQQNQPGDAGDSGSDSQDSADPAQSGDQPRGPDNSDPGPGNPDGQRSSQPSAGENGSSQQSSEGTPSGEKGNRGDPGQSPGSQSEGAQPGKPSPGRGKPSGDGSGDPQPGGEGSQSKSGEQGGNESASGGQPADSGDASSGSQSESGSKPAGSETSDSNSDGQPASDRDQPGQRPGDDSQSEQSGDKPTERGQPRDSGEPGGSRSDGETGSGGDESPSGSKQQSDGPQENGAPQSGGEGGSEGGSSESEGSGGNGSGDGNSPQQGTSQSGGGEGQPGGAQSGLGGAGTDSSQQAGPGSGAGDADFGDGAEAANLDDKKRVTELVLRKLQDELRRGEVSEDLLQDLGWTEDKLHNFMDRLDRRLSDSGEDESPASQARRRQFHEILRGIDYSSEGRRQSADANDRPVTGGSGAIPRRPAPTEFQQIEESFRRKLSRQSRSK